MSNVITPYEEPQTPALTLAEALEEYRLAVEAAGRFRMDHADVLNELELHEAAAAEAKEAILGLMTESNLDFIEDDHFAITRTQPDRGHYEPDWLPEWLRTMPGVVKRVVDAKEVHRILKERKLPKRSVKSAWIENKIAPSLRITNKDGKNG